MKNIRLTSPQDKAEISQKNPRLSWEPYKGKSRGDRIFYTLVVFATRPDSKGKSRTDPLPLFRRIKLKRNYFDLSIRDRGLKPGRSYWWQIEAQNEDGETLGISKRRRFKIEKDEQLGLAVTDIIMEARIPDDARYVTMDQATMTASASLSGLREQLLPPPPIIWGKPVTVRRRSELSSSTSPGSETPPEESGDTIPLDPLALVWGSEGGEIYLPIYLVRNCSVFWDLSGNDDCERVLLQVSGDDGFSEPSDGNIMEDAGVINHFWGPPRISCTEEIETCAGPPPMGSLIPANMVDLLRSCDSEYTGLPPSDLLPEIVRQVRVIACNDSGEPVDVASDPFTIHCVKSPTIEITAATAEWTWGENPGREIHFALFLQDRFPDVPVIPTPAAPSTLLIYTPSTRYGLDESTCAHVSLEMNGVPVERQNRITIQDGRGAHDMYVIPIDEWSGVTGFDFTLRQEWHGGVLPISLVDFIEPTIVAAVIPGVPPDRHYCGGIFYGIDSLYGRDDLPDQSTLSPLYRYPGACLPRSIIDGWTINGLIQFNDFLSQTFRGTRTVNLDPDGVELDYRDVDESAGVEDVVVHFETSGTTDLRYALPSLHEPVIMREERGGVENLWEVKILDGKYASMYSPDGVLYRGRTGTIAGTSRFDPPRIQIWLSVRAGSRSSPYTTVWADIHYDLTAD